MVAATYIQIFKTSLLAVMVLAVFIAVIARTGWNPIGPMLDAADEFGAKVVEPNRSDMTESLNSLSLTVGLALGIMGLPHVMLRFLTVRVDELEEGPSSMLQSRGREERPRRFDDRPRRYEDRGPRPEPVQVEAATVEQ